MSLNRERGKSLISAGLMVAGAIAVVAPESAVQPEYGLLSETYVIKELEKVPLLTQIEKDFIVTFIKPYLNKTSLFELIKVARTCKDTYGPNARLTFLGFPAYDNTGNSVAFVLYAFSCGEDNGTNLTSDISVSVPSFHHQLITIATGFSSNTVAAGVPMNDEEGLHFNFEDAPLRVSIPNYSVGGSDIDPTKLQFNPIQRYDESPYVVLNEEAFSHEIQKVFEKYGLCAFTRPNYAERMLNAQEYLITYESPNFDGEWEVHICSMSMTGESYGPTEYNLNALPNEVRRFMQSLFGEAQLPLSPGTSGKISVSVNFGGKKETITFYQDADPAVTSSTVAFREGQLKGIRTETSKEKLPIKTIVIILAELVGSVGLVTSLRKLRLDQLQEQSAHRIKQERAAREEAIIRKKEEQEAAWRLSLQQSREKHQQPEPQPTPVFTCLIGTKEVARRSFGQDELVLALSELTQDQLIQKRIEASKKEIADIINTALRTEYDFSDIQRSLKRAGNRVTEDTVGGDSIVVYYQVINQKQNIKEVLGQLLIDVDLYHKNLKIEFYPGETPVEEQEAQKAAETVLQENVGGNEVKTVKEAAELLVYHMNRQLTDNLDQDTFDIVRKECQRLAKNEATYSQLKKEAIRQLGVLIKNKEIPIIAIDVDSKLYVRIVADRIFDYMTTERTGAGDYSQFTSRAVNYLERNFLEIFESTAYKGWETRTLNRIMMVQVMEQVEDEVLKRVKIVITDNNH